MILETKVITFSYMYPGPDPERSNTGGHRMSRHDASGGSGKGESMRGGLPLSYTGPGVSPGKNLGNCGAGEAFFKPVLGQNVRFQA